MSCLTRRPRYQSENGSIVWVERHCNASRKDTENSVRVELTHAERRVVADSRGLQPRPPRHGSGLRATVAIFESNHKNPAGKRSAPRMDSAGVGVDTVVGDCEDAREAEVVDGRRVVRTELVAARRALVAVICTLRNEMRTELEDRRDRTTAFKYTHTCWPRRVRERGDQRSGTSTMPGLHVRPPKREGSPKGQPATSVLSYSRGS